MLSHSRPNVIACFCLAGKTTRTPTRTVTTHSRPQWTETKRYSAARTTTKRPLGPQTTPRPVRLYSWRRTRDCSPCTDWHRHLGPAPSRYRARIQYTIITPCTMRPYWTLCRPTWSTSALRKRWDFTHFEWTRVCVYGQFSKNNIMKGRSKLDVRDDKPNKAGHLITELEMERK